MVRATVVLLMFAVGAASSEIWGLIQAISP
jgi:hypothetical protein